MDFSCGKGCMTQWRCSWCYNNYCDDTCDRYRLEGKPKYWSEIVYPFYDSNNSSSEVKISLKIGDKILPINAGTIIVNSCVIYTELKIRLSFDKDVFAVRFIYLSHMLDTKLRADLMNKNFIQDGLMYSEGVVVPI